MPGIPDSFNGYILNFSSTEREKKPKTSSIIGGGDDIRV
jgi:hypothetical protein